jgi:predicted flavoprotein YhiN
MTLTIENVATPLSPIVIGTAGGTEYELISFAPGRRVAVNKISDSTYVDGGVLISTRQDIVTMSLIVCVTGTSLSDLGDSIWALGDLLEQFGYTITDSTTTDEFLCLPASWERSYDPLLATDFMDYVTASIPRQP